MSKVDQTVDIEYGMETSVEHFKGRQIGAVDAAYMLAGWSKHRSSRGTIFISVVFPGKDERRLLKPKVATLPANSTDIFSPTHVQKYQFRHGQTHHLTLIEYMTLYKITKEEGIEDDEEEQNDDQEEGEGIDSNAADIDRETIDADEEEEIDERMGYPLTRPNSCTDSKGYRYTVRKRNRLPLWLTHFYQQEEQEPFYYQQVVLYFPFLKADDIREPGESWQDCFFRICLDDEFKMPEEQIQLIKERQTIIDQQQQPEATTTNDLSPKEKAVLELAETIDLLSVEQEAAFHYVITRPSTYGVVTIYGNAGTEKSFLLNALKNAFTADDILPVVLAPAGVAAHSINGSTIHSFFGIDIDAGDVNLIHLQDFLKINSHIALLIDECSIIDCSLLDILSNAFQRLLQNNLDFGGVPVIFFGDVAQLPPVNSSMGYFFQHPAIQNATTFLLKTPQRQRAEDTMFLQFLNNIRLGEYN